MWSETTVDGKVYPIFSIYVRDPYSAPDLSSIHSEVKEFCGAKATDPTSDFYSFSLSYANLPPCFNA